MYPDAVDLEALQIAAEECARLVGAEQQLAAKLIKGTQAAASQLTARTSEQQTLSKHIDEIERAALMKRVTSQKQARYVITRLF